MLRRSRARWLTAATLLALVAGGVGLRLYAGGLPRAELEEDYRDASGVTFLYSYDAHYYLRLSRNLLEHGHPGESLRNGAPWDDHSFAPRGRPVGERLLASLQTGAYRLLGGRVPLMRVAFHLPVVLGALTTAAIFWLGRMIAGDAGGLLSAFLFAAHPGLVAYGFAGLADSNALVLLFFVLVAGLFLSAVRSWRQDRRRAAGLLGIATLAALGLLRMASPGWVAAAVLVAAFSLGIGLAELRRSRVAADASRSRTLAGGLGLAAAGIAGAWWVAQTQLFRLVLDYVGKRREAYFPSGLDEVGELSPIRLPGMGSVLGGPLVVGLAAVALPFAFQKRGRLEAVFLAAWLVPSLLAGAGAVRFLVFALPPFVLLLGSGLANAIRWVTPQTANPSGPPSRPPAVRSLLAAAAAGALLVSFRPGYAQTRATLPPVDRAVYELATSLRERAAEDALLNVWWDYGYIYAALADRPVTLDGGSFRQPRLYWLSRALSVADEALAVGILRLVACGHEDEMFELLEPRVGGRQAARLIETVLTLKQRRAAREHLESAGIPPPEARQAARLAFCRPPPSFLIVSSDLVAKTHSWARYGQWEIGSEKPPRVPRIERPQRCLKQGPALGCPDGTRIRLDDPRFLPRHSADHLAWLGPAGPPELVRVVYRENTAFTTLRLERELADSVFAQLYFFNGKGLSRFKLFREVSYPSTKRVLAFRLRWKSG